jgi:hypothetical protein
MSQNNSFDFGIRLPNGATVIQARRIDIDAHIVLARFDNGYVTWQADNSGCTYWGHYFGDTDCDLACALQDFQTRAAGACRLHEVTT